MKFKEFKHVPVEPDTYEASMALNQLMRIGRHAIKLHNMIDDAAEMESWVAKKIDLAGDYVKKVYNYTEGEKAGLYDDSGMTEDKGSTMASRVIRNYAREIGPDSMDYDMFVKSADLLDKEMLKSLAQHIENSDTAPREYVMKKIADHDPDTFRKMYGDQEGYLSIMKPQKDLTDSESVSEDAPFGSGMDLVRMAVLRKFISAEEYMNYAKELKAAGEEVEEKYADWPEGEGFGSSDGNFAIKDMMSAAGYEFDEQDKGGRFIVTKMPEKLEKMGIKNARMRDAVTTDSLEARLEAKLREERIDIFDFEKRDEYNDDQEKYGDVDKTPLTPQERQQFKQWLISTANTYAQMAVDDGVDDIGEDLSNIEDKNHKFIPKIKEYLKQSHAKGNLEDFAGDVLDVEEKFGDPDMLLNDRGFRVAKDFSQHATNYEVFIKYASGDYTVKTIRGILDSIDDDPHISSAMLMFQTDFEGTPLQRKVSRVQASESVSEDAGEGHMSKSTLYHTAKYAIALMDMIKPGDDLEGWVQSKLNKAADYLQGVYNYEEYQKLNPYREELDASLMQKHAQVVQKNIDEILAKETKLDDIDTKPGMMRILAKRVNEVEKEIAKETRKKTDESGILYRAGVKKYGKAGMKAIQSAAGKGATHQEIGKIKDKHLKDAEDLEEGLKDWAKKTAMAGVIVAGLAGVGSIQDAIDRSVPAVQAMETALEMAQDQGNDELADMIKNDLSAVKVRLSSGKDLNFVKDMQDKYSKFVKTEGLAYESKLAIMLNQQLK